MSTIDFSRVNYYSPTRTAFRSEAAQEAGPCNCIGPQNGEELCPCQMRSKASKSFTITPPKGQPMPQTVEYYEKLAIMDLNLIMQQKAQIERLKRKNNQLQQKIKREK